MSKKKLTNKQKIFTDEYLKCLNGAEAARRAGYPAASAYQIAYENLRKPEILAEIEAKMKASAMSADEVLHRWTAQARGSMAPFLNINEEGSAFLDFSSDEAKESLHLLKQVRMKRTRRVQGKGQDAEEWEDEYIHVEIVDNQKALDALSKYHNLYAEKDEDGNPITDADRIGRLAEIFDAIRARRDQQTSN